MNVCEDVGYYVNVDKHTHGYIYNVLGSDPSLILRSMYLLVLCAALRTVSSMQHRITQDNEAYQHVTR
jgi:hypothetical protein